MSDLFPTSKQLEVTEDEIKNAQVFIKEYRKRVNKVKGSVTAEINKIIKDCISGWPTAPNTFRERILVKLGLKEDMTPKGGPLDHKPPEEKQLINDMAAAKRTGNNLLGGEGDDNEWLDLKVTLSNSEKKYMESRLTEYMNDFELNNSSDFPIIRSIILEEIMQRRIQTVALKASRGEVVEPNITKMLTESYERLHNGQELLGISGRQRIKKMTNSDGSIADLHGIYTQTLQDFPETELRWEAEEMLLLLRKLIRGEIREVDFKQLSGLSEEEARDRYEEFIKKGLLDPIKDSLALDNFGRDVKTLQQYNYQPIMQHLINTSDDQDIDDKEVVMDLEEIKFESKPGNTPNEE